MMNTIRMATLVLGATVCLAALSGITAIAAPGIAFAENEKAGTPEMAVCRTCEMRGSGHGEENVVASRMHEGEAYHFCSGPCAEAFDAFPAGYVRLPLPRPAPAVALQTLGETEIRLGEARDDLLLVDFWATWCKPCIKAMPKLTKLHRDYADDGLTILGISIDDDPKKVADFLEKKPLPYPVAIDAKEEPAWAAFGVAAIPAMYLIDREGRIVAEWKGRVEVKDVISKVEKLLAEETSTEHPE